MAFYEILDFYDEYGTKLFIGMPVLYSTCKSAKLKVGYIAHLAKTVVYVAHNHSDVSDFKFKSKMKYDSQKYKRVKYDAFIAITLSQLDNIGKEAKLPF